MCRAILSLNRLAYPTPRIESQLPCIRSFCSLRRCADPGFYYYPHCLCENKLFEHRAYRCTYQEHYAGQVCQARSDKGKRHSGDCCRSAAVIDGNMKRCGRSRRTDEEIGDGGRSGSSVVCGDVRGLRSDDNEGEGGVR